VESSKRNTGAASGKKRRRASKKVKAKRLETLPVIGEDEGDDGEEGLWEAVSSDEQDIVSPTTTIGPEGHRRLDALVTD